MKAMILAAGLGTRLKPFTDDKPKALVQIGGRTLLENAIVKLRDNGFDEIVVNVHHFSSMIIEYLQNHDFGVKIHISDESERLLDTGGGILKASIFLNGEEPFLVHNVDIVTDINLAELFKKHISSNSLSTLAVSKRDSSRVFLFDLEMNLSGWKNNLTGKQIIPDSNRYPLEAYAFAGIHVISPDFFTLIKTKGSFSIVDAYLSLCSKNIIKGYDVSSNFVLDVGKPENIKNAEKFISQKRISI